MLTDEQVRFMAHIVELGERVDAEELSQALWEVLELREALRQYADAENWGYYDDSGCEKGRGSYVDACFIGPSVAREALKNNM